jgi:hypothetical protein
MATETCLPQCCTVALLLNEVKCISDGPANVEAAVKEAISVHKSLVTLTPTNHLKLVKVHTAAHKVNAAKLKGWCCDLYTFR